MQISAEDVEKFKAALATYEREREFAEFAENHKGYSYIAWALFLSWCALSFYDRQFLYGGLCSFGTMLASQSGEGIFGAVFFLLPISFYFWGNWYTFAGYVLLFFMVMFGGKATPPEKKQTLAETEVKNNV